MPEFVKPFSGMVPERKMTTGELVRALRLTWQPGRRQSLLRRQKCLR